MNNNNEHQESPEESSYQIHLTRSHFDQIAVGAANTNIRHSSSPLITNEMGWWATKFDGGGNVRYPSSFVALYGETPHGEEIDKNETSLYALVEEDCHPQDNANGTNRRYLLKHKKNGRDILKLERNGLEMVESAVCSNTDDWEGMREKDLAPEVLEILQKTIDTVRGLFGQGGDFFETAQHDDEVT